MELFLQKYIDLMNPANIYYCDGSDYEYNMLIKDMVNTGTLHKLNRHNSYVAFSDPNDVARVEQYTYICSKNKDDAGPNNNWCDPEEMKNKVYKLFNNCYSGKTMYVIPYCMGQIDSPYSKLGIEITDSPYVVISMRIMTRMGKEAYNKIKNGGEFVGGVHALGDYTNLSWPCSTTKIIAHFPDDKLIYSYGSGYGGNALLGKKCFALRIGSTIAYKENWLAEHMLIVGVTNPEGIKKYFVGAFPSACGKTNFAMMIPSLPGWKVECIGDDIAWMHIKDGKLYAINPENGFFGVAPGTNKKSNPVALDLTQKDTIFTNVGVNLDTNEPWWEGMDDIQNVMNWKKEQSKIKPIAHPNSRFTSPLINCSILDSEYNNPEGVLIEGIIFGGRRSDTIPLVFESFDWNHGVFLGSVLSSETTAAAEGKTGVLRVDSFAMKPFCGYNMTDYFSHWIKIGELLTNKPRIFNVNWFQKDENAKFLWPGFGENIHVLKWMFEDANKKETSIGYIPSNFDPKYFEINKDLWEKEIIRYEEYYNTYNGKINNILIKELEKLKNRIKSI